MALATKRCPAPFPWTRFGAGKALDQVQEGREEGWSGVGETALLWVGSARSLPSLLFN